MKIRGLFVCLMMWIGTVQAQWVDVSEGRAVYNVHSIYSSTRIFQKNAALDNYDVSYYRLCFKIDPAVDSIRGKVTTYFRTKTSGFSDLQFNLSHSLYVDSVLYKSNKLNFTQTADDYLHITLPVPLDSAILDSVTVYYQGIPSSSGFGSFQESTHNGIPVMWTLSEPYGASDWWPCKKVLRDKADSIDIFIATPQQYRTAANGLLVDSTRQGSYKTYHWKHRYPIAHYLIGIAVTNYTSYYEKVPVPNADTIKVLNLVYPEYFAEARTLSPYIVSVMELYNKLFGTYPFSREKYGHAQFNWGGGMEHQTMTFVANFAPDLIAHELAHHWFGDKITLGTWRDIWLNEGFATYLNLLEREKLNPSSWSQLSQVALKSATASECGSVYADDTTDIHRIFSGTFSYNKGALVLHSLRWKLGDTAFFNGLRGYLSDTALAYKNAETPDLRKHLELASGQNLSSFFDKWVYGQGYPSYKLFWQQDSTKTITFTLDQTTSCPPSVSFFDMPVEVGITGNGHDTMVVLNHTYSGQQFVFKLGFVVKKISLDPHPWLISAHNGVYELGTASANEIVISANPNPVKESMQLSVSRPMAVDQLSMSDICGRTLLHIDKPFTNGNNMLTIDFTNIPRGIYFIYLRTSNGIVAKKIVAQ